jgi:hypothetical protein
LRHLDVAEEVDVEQAARLGERHRLHGRVDLDSGVVDEGAQRTAVGVVGDALHEHRDLGVVGDVEHDRLEVRGPERLGVGAAAHSGEDVEAAPGKSRAVAAPMPVEAPVTTRISRRRGSF